MAVQTLAEAVLVVRPDFTRGEVEIRVGARKVGEKAADETDKAYSKKLGESFAKTGKAAADRFTKGFESGGAAMAKSVAGVAAKVTVAAGAVASAAPAVASLTAALAPAAGALLVLPGYMLATKAAAGVLKIAVDGVSEAIGAAFTGSAKEAAAALEELNPEARKFAKTIIDMKGPIEELKGSISDRFFLPLNNDIKPLAEKYLPVLQKQLPFLAGVMGGFGEAAAKAAGQARTVGNVSGFFDNVINSVIRLRGAVPGLVTAFAAFTNASSSTLPGISTSLVNITNRFTTFVTKASESGRVVEAFENAKTTLKDLGTIIGNVGSILATVYRVSGASGAGFLENLKALTGQAREFVQSAQGTSALTSVFETLARIGESLRTGLGAALPEVASSIQIAAPLVGQLADVAGRLLAALSPLLPALTGLTVEILTALLPAIQSLTTWLENNQSVVTALAPVILGLVAAQKAYAIAMGVATAAQAVNSAAIAFSNTTLGVRIGVLALDTAAWVRSTAATVASTAAMVTQRAVMIASTAATWIAAAATTALGVAVQLATSPITLIIIAIGLLIAAIVYLYRNNETAKKIIDGAWKAIKTAVKAVGDWFKDTLIPSIKRAIDQGVTAFNWIRDKASAAWTTIKEKIKVQVDLVVGMFNSVKKFITETLPDAFETGVTAIGKAWDKVKETAKKPVSFVVNSVINPLISGFNKVAGTFGVDKVATIPGFAEGGRIPGAPSSRDNRIGWLKNGAGKMISNIEVATGEFIVNARDTAKALPLLRWINDGMKGGDLVRRLGRPLTERPGDGSEGWAFADGGLVGFFKDVWGVVSDPVGAIKKPFEAMLEKIPGSGSIVAFLKGMGKKLIGGFMDFITGKSGGAGGNIGAAQAFVKAQAGKPYVWAGAGPGGYDCSGIVSAVYNVMKGKNPYSHTFSTGQLPGQWFKEGPRVGPLVAGWAHPGQRGASASVGHMAGMIAGLPFESTGSRGVRVGAAARSVEQFAHIGVAKAAGGLVDIAKVARADFGSVVLERGHNLIYNGTGQPEPLRSPGLMDAKQRMHPDDIEKLADALARALGRVMMASVPATRVAARQMGKR